MSANPHANGGRFVKRCGCLISGLCIELESQAKCSAENTRPLGQFLRDIMEDNMKNFRVFGPDENTSNKLDAIYEVSKKTWLADYFRKIQTAANYRLTGG